MLFTEAVKDPKVLAAKQSYIDVVAKTLDKAGIKYERNGSTSLDVYNNVSKTRPIYVVKATKGGVNLVDDSAARIATSGLGTDALDVKTIDSKSGYNKYLKVSPAAGDKTYNRDSGYKAVFNPRTAQYDFYKPSHYYTGVKTLVSGNATRYNKYDNEYLYGHFKLNQLTQEWTLGSIDVVDESGNVKHIKSNSTRQSADWDYYESVYSESLPLDGVKQAEAVADYIVKTIDKTTVNAAESSGKTKYYIEPVKLLVESLQKYFYNVRSNIDEVSKDNAIRPLVTLTPIKGIDLQITFSRQGKRVYAIISNVSKTLLYLNAKKNIDKINDPKYIEKIATVVLADFSGRDESGKVLDLYARIGNHDKSFDVVEAIDSYVDDWKPQLARAFQIQNQYSRFNRQVELAAAEQEAQQKKNDALAQKLFKKQMDDALAQKDYEEKLKQQKAEDKARLRDIKKKTDDLRADAGENPQEFFDREVENAFGDKQGMEDFINQLVDKWDD